MIDKADLRRQKNVAYAALEAADVAILKWRTTNSENGREPLPVGWAEKRVAVSMNT